MKPVHKRLLFLIDSGEMKNAKTLFLRNQESFDNGEKNAIVNAMIMANEVYKIKLAEQQVLQTEVLLRARQGATLWSERER